MLAKSGMQRLNRASNLARQRLASFHGPKRTISSYHFQSARRPSHLATKNRSPLSSGIPVWQPAISAKGLPLSARFNSTSSGPAQESIPQPDGASSEFLSQFDLSTVPEHIGYLKELGLDYGWGTSSLMESVIEHIHIWTGLPWWASIVGTGLLIRLALFKPALNAADNSTKMNNFKHELQPFRDRLKVAIAERNSIASTQIRAEMMELQKKLGISSWKAFIPLLQIPLGYGCFRVINGMTSLPVPGLAAESVGWIRDLTAMDPYFILPLATSFFMHLTFKKGGEAGMSQMTGTSAWKITLYVFPALSFMFMSWFPSALQLYFATTGVFSVAQAYLLSSTKFRLWANITLPSKGPELSQETGPRLRMVTDLLEEEKRRRSALSGAAEATKTSSIDRSINAVVSSGKDLVRDVKDFIGADGNPAKTNPDGTRAPPPRLNKEALKSAEQYEISRREEEDRELAARNRARIEAYQRAQKAQKAQKATNARQ